MPDRKKIFSKGKLEVNEIENFHFGLSIYWQAGTNNIKELILYLLDYETGVIPLFHKKSQINELMWYFKINVLCLQRKDKIIKIMMNL